MRRWLFSLAWLDSRVTRVFCLLIIQRISFLMDRFLPPYIEEFMHYSFISYRRPTSEFLFSVRRGKNWQYKV